MILLLAILLAQAESKVRVCDKADPTHCATVNASGQLSISGTISASTTGRATAAAPSYTEGTDNPLSIDLSGNIRTLATAQTAAKATAADPSYVEGSTSPLSQDLAGYLRVRGVFWQATQPVSGTFWQAIQPVSGTFWQATQPVSGTFWPTTAALPASIRLSDGSAFYDARSIRLLTSSDVVDVSDRTARLLGHVTVDNASIAVTGTFWQATQPVSAVSLPLPSGAATDATLAETHGVAFNAAPAKLNVVGGVDAQGRSQQVALAPGGIVYVQALPVQPVNPFLPRCNPVRRTNCQP